MSDEVNAAIMGASIPSATFREEGSKHQGIITAMQMRQAKKYGKEELDTWPDGQPKMQAVITIRTDERDPEIEDDNGMRRIYVGSPNMRKAIAEAVKKAGATGLTVGGTLGVKFTRRDPNGKNPDNLPKLYQAVYESPPVDMGFDGDEGDYDDYSDEPF